MPWSKRDVKKSVENAVAFGIVFARMQSNPDIPACSLTLTSAQVWTDAMATDANSGGNIGQTLDGDGGLLAGMNVNAVSLLDLAMQFSRSGRVCLFDRSGVVPDSWLGVSREDLDCRTNHAHRPNIVSTRIQPKTVKTAMNENTIAILGTGIRVS